MLKITRIETIYPAPDDEGDYCPEGASDTREETVSFRQLVDLMREHVHPSASHLRGTEWEWFSTDAHQDPYTGEYTEQSLHYARDNAPRMLKYWRAAMRAAGHCVIA